MIKNAFLYFKVFVFLKKKFLLKILGFIYLFKKSIKKIINFNELPLDALWDERYSYTIS